MIKFVDFNSRIINAGENIIVKIDAVYPVAIEIKCFVTQPPPPKFVPCPDSGRHILTSREAFYFSTNAWTFQNNGHVEFQITDAEYDTKVYRIEVEGLNKPLAGLV